MNYSTKRDFSERAQDHLAGHSETLQRAQERQPGQFPAVTFGELYQAVIRPPGPTETQVSRVPGANLSPGVEVAGARLSPAGMRGAVEQFPSVVGARTTALVRNLLSTSRFHAAVHVQRGAGPGDPPWSCTRTRMTMVRSPPG